MAQAQALVDPATGTVPGNLVSVTSEGKGLFLYRSVGRWPGDSWFGLADREGVAPGAFESQGEANNRTTGWAWTNSDLFDYNNWNGGEPNDWDGREDAGHFTGGALWNDNKSGYTENAPVVPTVKPGTSLDESGSPPGFNWMVEYCTDSPTPFPGIRFGMVFPPCDVVGPGMPVNTAGNWSLREVRGLTMAGNAFDALDKAAAGTGTLFEQQVPYLDVTDPDTNGTGGPILATTPFPYLSNNINPEVVGDDHILSIAKTRIRVATADTYTIQVRGDDGFALRIKGQPWVKVSGDGYIDPLDPTALLFERGTGDANTRGVIDLPAGDHDVEFIHWEGDGGAYYEVTSATGERLNPGDAQWLPFGSTDSLPAIDATNAVYLEDYAGVHNQRLRNTVGGYNVLPAMRYNVDNNPGSFGIRTNLQIDETAMPGGFADEYVTKVTGTITVAPNANGNATPGELIPVTFRLNCDDGASLRVIGQDFLAVNPGGDSGPGRLLVDNGGDMTLTADFPTGDTNARGLIELTEGASYQFVACMYEYGGGSNFNLYWQLGDHVAADLPSPTSLSTNPGPIAITGVPDPVNYPGQVGALVTNVPIVSTAEPGGPPYLPATRAIMADAVAQQTTVSSAVDFALLRGADTSADGRPGTAVPASTRPMPIGVNEDNYLTKMIARIVVDDQDSTPGETLTVTFGLFADDGADLHIVGKDFSAVYGDGRATLETIGADTWLVADYWAGNTNALGVIELVEGTYDLESHSYEGGGGSGHEIWWALGACTGFDPAAFRPLSLDTGFYLPPNTGIPLVAGIGVPPINQGTLALVNEPGFNQLTLSLAVSGIGSDSDTSTITGSLLTRLDIDPATGRSPEFTILGGNLQGTPVSLQIKVLFVTVVDVSSTTIGGTVATITPPGTIDPLTGQGDAAQHEVTINQGTVSGTASGSPISFDFTTDPVSGTGSGTATVTITPAGTTSTRGLFNVAVTLPVSLSEPIPNDLGLTATISATGTIKAAGQVSVPLSDYLAWTEAEGVPGADPGADPDADGISNGMVWALGLGFTGDPRPHLLTPRPSAPRSFTFTLPPCGSAGTLFIESSTTLAPGSWTLVSPPALSPPVNPLPPGSFGTFTINPPALPARFFRLRAEP